MDFFLFFFFNFGRKIPPEDIKCLAGTAQASFELVHVLHHGNKGHYLNREAHSRLTLVCRVTD